MVGLLRAVRGGAGKHASLLDGGLASAKHREKARRLPSVEDIEGLCGHTSSSMMPSENTGFSDSTSIMPRRSSIRSWCADSDAEIGQQRYEAGAILRLRPERELADGQTARQDPLRRGTVAPK